MAFGLVAWPVLIGVIIGVGVFIIAGPAIAALARNVYGQIKETIEDIKETWRSKE